MSSKKHTKGKKVVSILEGNEVNVHIEEINHNRGINYTEEETNFTETDRTEEVSQIEEGNQSQTSQATQDSVGLVRTRQTEEEQEINPIELPKVTHQYEAVTNIKLLNHEQSCLGIRVELDHTTEFDIALEDESPLLWVAIHLPKLTEGVELKNYNGILMTEEEHQSGVLVEEISNNTDLLNTLEPLCNAYTQ